MFAEKCAKLRNSPQQINSLLQIWTQSRGVKTADVLQRIGKSFEN